MPAVPMRSIRVPDETWNAAKARAAERGIALGQYIVERLSEPDEAKEAAHIARFEALAVRMAAVDRESETFQGLRNITSAARLEWNRPDGPLDASLFNQFDLTALEELLNDYEGETA